jgi:hypothetical protein
VARLQASSLCKHKRVGRVRERRTDYVGEAVV